VARWRSAPYLVRRRASMTPNTNLAINPSVIWLNRDNLYDLSKEKVNTWRIKAKTGVQQVQEWLDGLKERYGNS